MFFYTYVLASERLILGNSHFTTTASSVRSLFFFFNIMAGLGGYLIAFTSRAGPLLI